MMISDDKIILRAVEPSDLDSLFIWENHIDKYESTAAPGPVSRQQIWQYIENYSSDPLHDGELRLIIVDRSANTPVGAIDLTEIDTRNRRAAVSIFIHESARRKGFAKAALRLLGDYCADALGLHQLWCLVAVDNAPSLALFKSAGYRPSGRLRSWIRRRNHWIDALQLQYLFP